VTPFGKTLCSFYYDFFDILSFGDKLLLIDELDSVKLIDVEEN